MSHLILVALVIVVINITISRILTRFSVSRKLTHQILGGSFLVGIGCLIAMLSMEDLATASRYLLALCLVTAGASLSHLMELRKMDEKKLIEESLAP